MEKLYRSVPNSFEIKYNESGGDLICISPGSDIEISKVSIGISEEAFFLVEKFFSPDFIARNGYDRYSLNRFTANEWLDICDNMEKKSSDLKCIYDNKCNKIDAITDAKILLGINISGIDYIKSDADNIISISHMLREASSTIRQWCHQFGFIYILGV